MGASCLMMYAMDAGMRGRPHYLSSLILLSPAGIHHDVRAYGDALLWVGGHALTSETPSPSTAGLSCVPHIRKGGAFPAAAVDLQLPLPLRCEFVAFSVLVACCINLSRSGDDHYSDGTEAIRVMAAKIMQDFRTTPETCALASLVVSKLIIGGHISVSGSGVVCGAPAWPDVFFSEHAVEKPISSHPESHVQYAQWHQCQCVSPFVAMVLLRPIRRF